MALERQSTQYTEARAAASAMLDAYERLRKVRNLYDGVGGAPFFVDFFAQANAPELTDDDFYALMVTVNAIEFLMDSGHYTNLAKARG